MLSSVYLHQGDGPPLTWTTTVDEVKAFIGFAILMGINELPEIRDYWSKNDQLHYFPVASRIPWKRFMELSTFLHFANNENIVARGQPEYVRLAKVRPVITTLQKSFFEAYSPHRENAIDKAMIKFKGRSSLKQYLPMKPIKCGFKVWVRSDSHNGYLCNFDLYTGKEESVETDLGAKVVKKLSRWVRDTTCTLTTVFHQFLCWKIFWKMSCMLVAPSAKTEGVFLRPL